MRSCGAQSSLIDAQHQFYTLVSGIIVEVEAERFQEAEDKGVFCETVSFRSVWSYTPEVSTTWLSKYDLSKDDTNRHADMDGECPGGFNPIEKKLEATKVSWELEK